MKYLSLLPRKSRISTKRFRFPFCRGEERKRERERKRSVCIVSEGAVVELRGISSKVNNFTTRNRWKEDGRRVESVANECTLQFHGKRSRERPAYDRSLPFLSIVFLNETTTTSVFPPFFLSSTLFYTVRDECNNRGISMKRHQLYRALCFRLDQTG